MTANLITNILTILFSIIGVTISILVYFNSQRQYENAQKQYELNQKVFSDAHLLSRRQCALALIENWDRDTLKSRICITNKWKDRFQNQIPIKYHEIINYRDLQIKRATAENKNLDELITVTVHVQIILNYFENIALGIDNNIADEEVLNEAFLNTFERWYFILADYKKEISVVRSFDPWAPLDKLHKKWFPHKYNSSKNKQKPQTGSLNELV